MAELKGKIEVEVKEVKSVKGMETCAVCGRDFPLIFEEHYVARDVEKTGIMPTLTGQTEYVIYDAFDCPHCGCQNIVQSRKRVEFAEGELDCEEDHDGCVGCKYVFKTEDEEPCTECRQRYTDKYERSKEDE